MNTFYFEGRDYDFADELNQDETRQSIADNLVRQYRDRTITGFTESGHSTVTFSGGDAGMFLSFTGYTLESFVKGFHQLLNSGWEIYNGAPYKATAFSCSCYLKRSEEYQAKDLEIVLADVDSHVADTVTRFASAKAYAIATLQNRLRDELEELTNRDNRKKEITAELKKLKGAA